MTLKHNNTLLNIESHYAGCHYAGCRYGGCRYAECRYAESRGFSINLLIVKTPVTIANRCFNIFVLFEHFSRQKHTKTLV
jgi:hypothetical protein